MPPIARRRERLVGRARCVQHDLDRTLIVDQHGQDPPIAIAQLAGRGTDRDVDPKQPLVGTDRAQRAFCGERSSGRRGDAGAGAGRAEPPEAVHADQRQHARREHRRVFETEHPATVDHCRHLVEVTYARRRADDVGRPRRGRGHRRIRCIRRVRSGRGRSSVAAREVPAVGGDHGRGERDVGRRCEWRRRRLGRRSCGCTWPMA